MEDFRGRKNWRLRPWKPWNGRIPDRPVELFYEKVGDYTIDFEIRFWTDPEQKVF